MVAQNENHRPIEQPMAHHTPQYFSTKAPLEFLAIFR
jgi:hypothetical protein